MLFALVTFAVSVSFYLQPPRAPVSLSVAPTGATVESVAIGSVAWVNGVRPGMPARLWENAGEYGASGFDVALDRLTFGVSLEQVAPSAGFLMAGSILLVLAAAGRAGRIAGAATLASLGTGLVLLPLGPQLGLPTGLLICPVPLLVGLLALDAPNRRVRRTVDVLALVVGGLLLLLFAAAMLIEPPTWGPVWATPVGAALLVSGTGEALSVAWRYRNVPANSVGLNRLAAAAGPRLLESRMAGADSERSRLALQIHNRVLPVVSDAVRNLRGDDQANADRMAGIGRELRALMSKDDTVILELAGLGEAIRSQAALAGDDLPLTVRLTAALRRPPPAVELAAYRVAQAAIDNALRHSGADNIEVDMTVAERLVVIKVLDDGVGIDRVAAATSVARGRIGLAQMRVRAQSVRAELAIRDRSPRGTEVYFRWPR